MWEDSTMLPSSAGHWITFTLLRTSREILVLQMIKVYFIMSCFLWINFSVWTHTCGLCTWPLAWRMSCFWPKCSSGYEDHKILSKNPHLTCEVGPPPNAKRCQNRLNRLCWFVPVICFVTNKWVYFCWICRMWVAEWQHRLYFNP